MEIFDKEEKIVNGLINDFHGTNSRLGLFKNEEKYSYLLGTEESINIPEEKDDKSDLFLSIVNKKKLQNICEKLLNDKEFLSIHGIRSLSKYHEEHPYFLDGLLTNKWGQTLPIEMKYEPAWTKAPIHTGNSNWRGPIWFPMNFLIIESLKKFHEYFNICLQEEFNVLFPAVSHHAINLEEVATELSKRLINIFVNNSGKRAVYGDNQKLFDLCQKNKNDPEGQDLILFYEHFNGDTGQGLGASHQTGWTGLVANLIYQVGEYEYELKNKENTEKTPVLA